MNINIPKELVEAIGVKNLKRYGVDEERMRWAKAFEVSLSRYGQKNIRELLEMLKPHAGIRGAKVLIKDCELWLNALDGGADAVKPRRLSQFNDLLRQVLIQSAEENVKAGRPSGPRLYRKDESRGVWLCYYVSRTDYHPELRRDGYVTPAYVDIGLVWQELGGNRGEREDFKADDALGRTVLEALANKGFVLETAELRAEYERRRSLFHGWYDKIGKQFLATGIATDDLDGNPKGRRDSWYWSSTKTIQLDKTGEPARVVIDVFQESDDENDRRSNRVSSDAHVEKGWWHRKRAVEDRGDAEGEDEEDSEMYDDMDWDEIPDPEVPLHPTMACFDLRRHLRLRIDVGQMQEYVYDPKLNEKLILPADSRNLVEMLLAHKGQFRDIVKGKSGGAIILCAGVPGTGKTLTSEVYAEVMARPLYTVQASQLGTDPDTLEDELLKTFARSSRWGAILLLDEADVYVHTRGSDLQQNAIVGVFLRVLEYYKGVLFLTTNRSDLVDDAIASRCVARIDYKAPIPEDQKRIWRVLASTAGIDIRPEVIDQVVERYPELTGRDVKNLLKLAKLVSDSRECPITLDVIRFVKRFKPTISTVHEGADDAPVSLPPMPERDDAPEEQPADVPAMSPIGVTPEGEPRKDWRASVIEVFSDGAPHGAAEAKEAVAKIAPAVHPNAVTVVINQLTKGGKLTRLASGLYQKAS